MSKLWNVAVVGATGAVGEAMIEILEQRDFPVEELYPLASERSAGKQVSFRGRDLRVGELASFDFRRAHIGLFSAGASVSAEYAPKAAASGCVVVDNTSQFRYDADIPLIVPEVNLHALARYGERGIIANPNCSTIQMVVALNPIYKAAGIKRIIVSTFQAASGAGRSAVDQLYSETKDICSNLQAESLKLDQSRVSGRVLPQQIAFNVFPHLGGFGKCDYTNEEWKLVHETHKILHDPKIKISGTCVRVPVRTGHSESVYIETKKKISVAKIRSLLSKDKAIKLIDQPQNNLYPSPLDCEGRDEVFVGRIRKDPYLDNGIWLWVVSDNLRKGAALNAVQIAESLISQ